MMVPVALAVLIVALLALDKLTVKPSSSSTVLSPLTLTVIVLLVSPVLKSSVPEGKLPPKSFAFDGLLTEALTAQETLLTTLVSPVRVTVNV